MLKLRNHSTKRPFYRSLVSLLFSFFLLSCEQSSESKTPSSGSIDPGGTVALAIPKALQKTNFASLEGEIEVADIGIFTLEIDLDGSGACGVIGACMTIPALPAGIHTFTIRYFLFDLNDKRILVATASTPLEILAGSTTAIIFPPLIKPDNDGDGFDNLEEIELGTNPENPGSFPNQAPNGVIDSPVGNQTINTGESIDFTGTGTDPNGDTSLTFFWNFDGGATNSTTEDPGPVTFNTPGTFTITFTVTDALGLSDATPDTRTITVNNQAPNGVIDAPSGDRTINAGESIDFTGTGADPDGNTPLTFLWDFDGGATDVTVEDPEPVTFDTPGIYTITFVVTDSLNLDDPSPDSRIITVNDPLVGKFAYVANAGSDSVAAFSIHPTTGELSSILPVISTEDNPVSVTVDPFGRFAYLANKSSHTVSAYKIDAASGALTAIGPAVSSDGNNPLSVAVHPSARFAYVANAGSDTLAAFEINPDTGSLRIMDTFATEIHPEFVVVDPSSQFVYVINETSNSITAFTINSDTGLLKEISGLFLTGSNPASLAVDPSGQFIYVVNFISNTVSAYKIENTGALTDIGDPIVSVANPLSIAIDPSGKFVYVVSAISDTVAAYAINPTSGALTNISDFPLGDFATSVTVDPSGQFTYVTNPFSNTITTYKIDAADGKLTNIGTIASNGNTPTFITTSGTQIDPNDPASFPISEIEPNDTVSTAQPITIPAIITGIAKESDPGSLALLPNNTTASIEDAYAFTLDSTAVLNILLNTQSSGNFDLYLHSVTSNLVFQISTNPGNANDVLNIPLFPGDYRILVDAVAVINDEMYTLTVTKDPAVLEREPNESVTDAQPLTLPSVAKGTAQAGDTSIDLLAFGDPISIEDQYTFTLTVPTHVLISLTSTDRLADFDLYLGSRDTSLIILRSANANNNLEFISTSVQLGSPLSPGQYDIYVDAMDSASDENYTLTLSIQE